MTLVTNLALTAGVASAPLTVVDTAHDNNIVPNANVSWIFDTSGLAGNLVVSPLGGGAWSFLASSPIAGNSLIHAVYTSGSVSIVGPELTLTIDAEITLGYSM